MLAAHIIRIVATVLFAVMFIYRIVYIVVSVLKKPKKPKKTNNYRKYAVISCARNEAAVIAQLIESVKRQKYPKGLIDVFVIADNCTDDTAKEARRAGAIVYERFNDKKKGKGYALDAIFKHMDEDGYNDYDGYFIFDSDNILPPDYIDIMNRAYDPKYGAIASCRLSKNMDESWVAYSSGLCFLREMRFLNYPRQLLNTSASISGTGFMLMPQTIERMRGWKCFGLTEDLEFNCRIAIKGRRIGYCHAAKFYDEQPSDMKQSWIQRLRWAKGYYQVIAGYGKKLVQRLPKKRGFAAWDLLCSFVPAFVLVLLNLIADIVDLIVRAVKGISLLPVFTTIFQHTASMYFSLLLLGLLVLMLEWKYIQCKTSEKLLYLITFPVYMMTFVPISVEALFRKVEWAPIKHYKAESIDKFQ